MFSDHPPPFPDKVEHCGGEKADVVSGFAQKGRSATGSTYVLFSKVPTGRRPVLGICFLFDMCLISGDLFSDHRPLFRARQSTLAERGPTSCQNLHRKGVPQRIIAPSIAVRVIFESTDGLWASFGICFLFEMCLISGKLVF